MKVVYSDFQKNFQCKAVDVLKSTRQGFRSEKTTYMFEKYHKVVNFRQPYM